MSMSDRTPRLQRASKPKVRTGCATCKSRRVKCDEARPACRRCIDSGFSCAGYPAIHPRANAAGRQVSPRPSRSSAGIRAIHARVLHIAQRSAHTLGCSSSSLSNMTLAQDDIPYFDLFRYRVAIDLSGRLYDNFWNNVVPREATTDECVKQEILALGALSKAMFFDSEPMDVRPGVELATKRVPSMQQRVNCHFAAAFRYHSHTLSTFAGRFKNKSVPGWSRATLIMTLMILAFEFMQGNTRIVDGMMKSGVLLLLEYHRIEDEKQQKPQQENHADLDDTRHLLPAISLMCRYTYLSHEQRKMFHTIKLPTPDLTVNLKPSNMTDLIGKWGNTFQRCIVFITHVMMHVRDCISYDQALREECQTSLLRSLKRWKEVFNQRDRESANIQTRDLGLELIFIQHLVSTILVTCCTDATDMAYDNFNAEFLEIVDRCTLFLERQGPGPRIPFVFNSGDLTSAISLVVSKCRHLQIRKRSIELLKHIPWRDGAWDRQVIKCKLGVAMLEEQERDAGGGIGPLSRWSWSDTQWDHPSGNPLAEYTRSTPDEYRRPVKTWILHT